MRDNITPVCCIRDPDRSHGDWYQEIGTVSKFAWTRKTWCPFQKGWLTFVSPTQQRVEGGIRAGKNLPRVLLVGEGSPDSNGLSECGTSIAFRKYCDYDLSIGSSRFWPYRHLSGLHPAARDVISRRKVS